jgi:hypothetical protein
MEPSRSESCDYDSEVDTSSALIYDKIDGLLQVIGTRGTGEHVCPLGSSCRKGGWKDDTLIVFTRNSSFK